MIKEFEFFHGLVFAKILHAAERPVSIKTFETLSNAAYLVNGRVGIYIKYSAKRMTPWRFTFTAGHQAEIDLMKSKCVDVFLVLVCNDDGVVCLNYEELKEILDDQHDAFEWISATRHKREMYSVKGSNGELNLKVGQNDFPRKLFITGSFESCAAVGAVAQDAPASGYA
jgi:hypothetical protein